MDVEWKIFRFRDVSEVAFDVFAQPVERNLLDFDGDSSGLDLGEVENVVDEIEQIGAGRINVAREFYLLVGKVSGTFSASCWLRMRIELSGVRNSWDMLARNSDLYLDVRASSMAFSSRSVTGLLHLGVLALDFRVLVREQLRLGAQFLVRLLQFALPRLKFDGQLLGLRKQTFRPHRGLDGVEDGAEAQG